MLRALLTLGLLVALVAPADATKRKKTAFQLSRVGQAHAGEAMRTYKAKRVLPNGYVYGNSVRRLVLDGLPLQHIDALLTSSGFTREVTVLRHPESDNPIRVHGKTIPIHIYVHPDGGTVRIKPRGVPTSALMPQPHLVKSLRWPYDAPGDGFANEALKVDRDGTALPRIRAELRIRPGVPRKTFVTQWAHRAHVDLVVE